MAFWVTVYYIESGESEGFSVREEILVKILSVGLDTGFIVWGGYVVRKDYSLKMRG